MTRHLDKPAGDQRTRRNWHKIGDRFARIEGSLQDGTSNRYLYSWSEVAKVSSGYDGFDTFAGGDSGTVAAYPLYNLPEVSGDAPEPIPNGAIVPLFVGSVADAPEFWTIWFAGIGTAPDWYYGGEGPPPGPGSFLNCGAASDTMSSHNVTAGVAGTDWGPTAGFTSTCANATQTGQQTLLFQATGGGNWDFRYFLPDGPSTGGWEISAECGVSGAGEWVLTFSTDIYDSGGNLVGTDIRAWTKNTGQSAAGDYTYSAARSTVICTAHTSSTTVTVTEVP